jgi:hypothetical protein
MAAWGYFYFSEKPYGFVEGILELKWDGCQEVFGITYGLLLYRKIGRYLELLHKHWIEQQHVA